MRDRSAKLFLRARNLFFYRNFEKATVENESDAYDGQFLAESMPTLLPAAKRYVIVYAQTEAMMTCKDAFVASLRSPGRIVLQEAIPADTRDLRPLLLNVRRASPDAVLIAAFLPETGLFLRLAREQDFRVAFIGISTSYDPKLFEVAGRAADGLLFSAPFFDPSQQDPGIRSFVSAYTSAYGKLPDVWAAYGYDVVLIALQAIGSDIRPLNRALLSMAPFDGVTGRTVFNKDGSVTKALRMLRADASTQSFKSASTNQ